MDRFNFSPEPSHFAKWFIKEHQEKVIQFRVQPPRPIFKPKLKKEKAPLFKPEQQNEKPEVVIEHYLDENGRWIAQ